MSVRKKNALLVIWGVALLLSGFYLYTKETPTLSFTIAPIQDVHAAAQTINSSALTWLLGQVNESGSFTYEFDPKTGTVSTKNNELRQLMASRVLAQHTDTPERARLHEKNLEYIFKQWYREKDGIGYVYFEDKSKLGANAMLLRELVESPHFAQHRKKADALVRGITSLMHEDGSFSAWLYEPSYAYNEDHLLSFYAGEALLSLFEYREKVQSTQLTERLFDGLEFYHTQYVTDIEKNYYPAYVPWMTLALEKAFRETQNTRYRDAVFVLNDRLITMQDTTMYPGRFYDPHTPQYGVPHTASDAVYTESLVHALLLAREANDEAREKKYSEALHRSLGFLNALQYKEAQSNFVSSPETYVGALRCGVDTTRVRLDCTQHLIDGLSVYLDAQQREH